MLFHYLILKKFKSKVTNKPGEIRIKEERKSARKEKKEERTGGRKEGTEEGMGEGREGEGREEESKERNTDIHRHAHTKKADN